MLLDLDSPLHHNFGLLPAKMKTKVSVNGQDGALLARSNGYQPNYSMALVMVQDSIMNHRYMILLVTIMVDPIIANLYLSCATVAGPG